MDKRSTHFEQVPLKIAKKVAEAELKRKQKSPIDNASKPNSAIVPVEATIVVGAGDVSL